MPIDASIYQNIRPVQMPDPLDAAQKAMTLSQLGMQQQQMQLQFQQQQALRQAYAQNVGPDGNVNKQGVLSSLSRLGMGHLVPDLAATYAKQDKEQAEAQSARADAEQKAVGIALPYLENLDTAPKEQKSAVYHNAMQELAAKGLPMHNVPAEFSQDWLNQTMARIKSTPAYLEQQLKKSEIGKNNSEQYKIGAEELGKFNEDVNNPSSRKMTGTLKDMINRADRISALSNAGAKPGETPEQRMARLNQIMPQIAKEFNVSLAAIMQGGVPTEGLTKELDPDTVQSSLAALQQKFTANPTAANQGALIQQYVNTAQHLREFASQRLQDVTERSRSAYPYARKLFPKEMDRIGAPLAAPATGDPSPPALAGESGSSALVPNANAAPPMPKPGDVRKGHVFNGGDPSDKRNWKRVN